VLIIGGAEDRGSSDKQDREDNNLYEKFEILKELLPKNGTNERIEIITTASDTPAEMKKMYQHAFNEIGYSNVGFIDIKDKIESRKTQFCKKIEKAHAVFFNGGDQFKLATTLGGTETIDLLKDKYQNDKDFIIAGTSAGAMAIPN